MALSAKGIVYLWGSSEHGQLGLGRKKQRKLPVQLKTEGKVLVISAGAYHSAYVNNEGHLFTFGEYGPPYRYFILSRESSTADSTQFSYMTLVQTIRSLQRDLPATQPPLWASARDRCGLPIRIMAWGFFRQFFA